MRATCRLASARVVDDVAAILANQAVITQSFRGERLSSVRRVLRTGGLKLASFTLQRRYVRRRAPREKRAFGEFAHQAHLRAARGR